MEMGDRQKRGGPRPVGCHVLLHWKLGLGPRGATAWSPQRGGLLGSPGGRHQPGSSSPTGSGAPASPRPSPHPASLSWALPRPGPSHTLFLWTWTCPFPLSRWTLRLLQPLASLPEAYFSFETRRKGGKHLCFLAQAFPVCWPTEQKNASNNLLYTSVKTLLILPGAAVTKHHRHGGLKQQTIPVWLLWRPEGWNPCVAGPASSEAGRGAPTSPLPASSGSEQTLDCGCIVAVFASSKDGCLQHVSLPVRASVTAQQGPSEPVGLTPEGRWQC